jgi:hypothetical protein
MEKYQIFSRRDCRQRKVSFVHRVPEFLCCRLIWGHPAHPPPQMQASEGELYIQRTERQRVQGGEPVRTGGGYQIIRQHINSGTLYTRTLRTGAFLYALYSFLNFLGPKWHSPLGSITFHRAQESLDFQGPAPSHLPS